MITPVDSIRMDLHSYSRAKVAHAEADIQHALEKFHTQVRYELVCYGKVLRSYEVTRGGRVDTTVLRDIMVAEAEALIPSYPENEEVQLRTTTIVTWQESELELL